MSYVPVGTPAMTSMVATQPMSYAANYGASMYMPSPGVPPSTTAITAPGPSPSMYVPSAAVPTTTLAASGPSTSMYAMPAAAAPGTPLPPLPPAAVATGTPLPPLPPAAVATTPSYVPPPAAAPQFAMPTPVSLTAGLPDPARLEAEKLAYEKALSAQLDKQSSAVLEEAKIKRAMLEQSAKTELEQYRLQVEERYKMACLEVDRERDQVVTGLKEAAILQQTAAEERAAVAIADYNKKKAIEEMSAKSYQLQKQWYDGEAKLMAQYQSARQAGVQRGVFT